MLKKKIVPLNIREMEDSEIRFKKEKALMDFVAFWEEHGSLLITQDFFSYMNKLYDTAIEQLLWLERTEA